MSIQLIQQYYAKVERLIQYGGTRNESTLRKPFQDLLEQYARSKNLLLVPEVEYTTPTGRKLYPDGTLKDALRQDWGYWESKDEKDVLEDEIVAKFNKGYPRFNILFEDTQTAVLFQGGQEVLRASFSDAHALDVLLSAFVGYEPPEVREFHKAIELFSAEVQGLADTLRSIIEEQYASNAAFKNALLEFLELCRKAINPRVEMADVREMIIQHVLTEDIFMRVFDEADFHRENNIAHKLQEVAGTFYHGSTKHTILSRIAPYYEAINARASQISDHHEKQKFLKALYESFYRAYNPKAADRLGVVYTPDEIVRFMIDGADHLVFQHFGKTLGDKAVDILDPATGTGTFVTELIEHLPLAQLEYKYRSEIHCNEVAILPYYIANLNIEFTYKQKTGKYLEFENICFVDTLDNQGFTRSGEQQLNFFGLVDENALRIGKQNQRKISVVIGNPPYNANQANENENNKNREYPAVDKRIKETYIKHSTAQKTKVYDMYARFYRWASDRLDKNGVIAFITNSSFLDSRTFDGFRKVIANEFSFIYIVDLGGNIRKNPKLSGPTHNVFAIQTGVAIAFLVKTGGKGKNPAQIFYTRRPEMERASEKLEFLRTTPFKELKFESIHPDRQNNWLNLVENDWDDLIPVASKETKFGTEFAKKQAVFKTFSLGVSTNRDDWVYDFSAPALSQKIEYFIQQYNIQVEMLKGANITQINNLADYSIKWSDALKRNLIRGKKLEFDPHLIIPIEYRPYVKLLYYSEKSLSDRLTSNHFDIFGSDLNHPNKVIAVNASTKQFTVLANNRLSDLHYVGDSRCLPFYSYDYQGARVDNITDWALEKFHKHYRTKTITKQDIFHYVYAVLHHPAYRAKYAINLKREFPRLPFYPDFEQWAQWGAQLMNLHLNYETVEPYPLETQTRKVSETFRVLPRLIARKDQGILEIDTATSLHGVPPSAWDYRLGTYTALEWILERYKEKTPKDPTIREKFNTYRFADYKDHVIDLLRRVCRVSVETMKIVAEMPE